MTNNDLRVIFNTSKEQNDNYQEVMRKPQGKIKQGGTVQREHKIWQGVTKHIILNQVTSGKMREEKG